MNPAANAGGPTLAPAGDGWYRGTLALVLIVGLVGGAGGGLWLTLTISEAGSMLATPDSAAFVLAVNAVAHAVLMGWAGLALLATGLRVVPPWLGRRRDTRGLLVLSVLFTFAVAVGAAEWLLVGSRWSSSLRWAWVGEALVATLLGVRLIRRGTGSAVPWRLPVALLAIAGVVLVGSIVAEGCYRDQLSATGGGIEHFLAVVQVWQMPLRLAQLHGIGLCGVLGLVLILHPSAPAPRRDAAVIILLIVGIVGEVAAWLVYKHTGIHALAALLLPCWLLITIGAALVVVPHRLWRPRRDDGASWFLTAAIAWLAVSLALLLAWRGYHVLRGVRFSHCYLSAFGQAAAVGFVMQGVCALIARVRRLPADSQLGPLALINLGLLAQCVAFIGMDWAAGPWSKVLAGSGGALAVGLAWWITVAAVGLRRTPVRSDQP